jgi:hypothetical protein
LTLAYTAIALVAGLAFSLMDIPKPKASAQLYSLFMSAVFIIAGVLRFIKFRKDYPVQPLPEGATEDE